MKKMIESQLRAWRPRRPSAGLKRRIFGFASESDVLTARWLWSCVMPTMTCALLTLMAVHRDADGLGEKPATTVLWSVQNNAAYAAGDAQTPENHLAAVTFDWTNRSVFQSSIRFTPSTNLSN